MKKVQAIIRPEKVDDVKAALGEAGYPGIMVTQIEGHGRQKGVEEQFRGRSFRVEYLPKTKIEIVARSSEVKKIVNTIIKAARTGEIGDGKIFVYDIAEVYRIRTGEEGEIAI
ncbi:MAG: P-II family nitrogen regulator [Candidatus Omnitrophica bacterium]|nr:P-II family nitrogen regulator [Candidatus Omnitrophota bacterium]